MAEYRAYTYPVYLVSERSEDREAAWSSPFVIADQQFRSKKATLEKTGHRIAFRAYTHGGELVVQLRYEPEGGDIAILFDRGATRRKRHNLFTVKLKQEGTTVYEEHNYEVEELPLPPSIRITLGEREEERLAELTISLEHLRISSSADRVVGFNVARTLQPQGTNNLSGEFVSWSGAPGDRPLGGIGTGDLLLLRGLAPGEIEAWARKVGEAGSLFFTRWEKRDIPERIRSLVTEKKRGLTARLSAADIHAARETAERTEWGRSVRSAVLEIADYWASKSDDELFALVPDGNPRALSVGQFFGDPLHGGKRTAFEVCLERPYQYFSTATRTWWHNGMTIVNPTTGEELVLDDDGRGFVAPEGFPVPGARYMFTASYRLFLWSMLLGKPYCAVLTDTTACPETTGERYAGAIPNLAFAYRLTNDVRYAYKALLLLGRMAELIPYMNGNWGSGYYDTVQLSEPTTTECHWFVNYFEALDLLYDVIGEIEPALQAFFAARPDADGRTRTEPFSIRRAVREMVPYIVYSCEIERTRNADWSLRYINLELLIASFLESGPLMREVLQVGAHSLQAKLRNLVFRDGRYIYDSFGYLAQIGEQVALLANNNYRFRDGRYFPDGIDMFEDAQYGIRPVLEFTIRTMCGQLNPMFGDTLADNAEPLAPGRTNGGIRYSTAFDVAFGRMPSLRGMLGPLLASFPREALLEARLRSVASTNVKHALLLLAAAPDEDELAPYAKGVGGAPRSYLAEDSQISVLRAGKDGRTCKHFVLYGQPSAGHMHGDKLGLWIGAYGYHLLASAGGYPFTWISPKFDAWETHSAACTVIVVDGRNQRPSYSRQLGHYEGRLLQGAGMENTEANAGTRLERWCFVVTSPNGEDAYAIDLNGAEGEGRTFDYNSNGLDIDFGQVRFEGIGESVWMPLDGTLAGDGVNLYGEPGYGWMKALRRTQADRAIAWTYRYAGAGLRIHTVPPAGGAVRELLCAEGERGGQQPGRSRWEPYVIWRDTAREAVGDAGHKALFTAVLEPFGDAEHLAAVRALRRLDGEDAGVAGFGPVGLAIEHADGHRDVFIRSSRDGETVRFADDTAGFVCETDAAALLLRYRGDTLLAAEAIGFTRISTPGMERERAVPAVTGTVNAIDISERRIEINLHHALDESASGLEHRVAILDSPDYGKPSTYTIRDPRLEGKRLTFRSAMPLVLMDADADSPSKLRGLGTKDVRAYDGKQVLVDLKPGDSFRVPNRMYWSRGGASSGNSGSIDVRQGE